MKFFITLYYDFIDIVISKIRSYEVKSKKVESIDFAEIKKSILKD